MAIPTLYNNSSSYYSMIARLVLCKKEVVYEPHTIDLYRKMQQLTASYASIQPNMTVPTLVSGNDIIGSSRDILFYVDKNFPGPALVPEGYREIEIMQSWIDRHYEFANTLGFENLTISYLMRKYPIFRNIFPWRLAKTLPRLQNIKRQHPELAADYNAKIVLNQWRLKHFSYQHANDNFEAAYQKSIAILDTLEDHLHDKLFITGEQYSLADVLYTCYLARLVFVGCAKDLATRPHVKEYYTRLYNDSCFKTADIWDRMHIFRFIKAMFC